MKPILHSVPSIEEDDIEAIAKQLESRHLEDGEKVEEFEDALSSYIGKRYAVSTANGFGAIHLGLIALGVKKGDEVIIPSYTCSALLNPIRLVSATPVIADIDENGFNLTFDTIEKRISSDTKAIILPHTFGIPVDALNQIMKMGIPIIEDCAQAVGGEWDGQKLGSFGDLSIFSFYASKMLCAGDGGMLLTDNEQLYETAKKYRYYGSEAGKTEPALNYRYTNLYAALGLNQLKKLDRHIERRIEIATQYDHLLSNHEEIDICYTNKEQSCFYRYPVAVENRNKIKKQLKKKGIHAGFGVLENMHDLVGLPAEEYPHASSALERTLSIPIYPSLTEDQITFIAETLIETVESISR